MARDIQNASFIAFDEVQCDPGQIEDCKSGHASPKLVT